MKLYYSKGACSLVVRIILNEIGLDFESESVNLQTKKTETGCDFLTINAKGSVPTLQLDNGEQLTENAIILQYLADTSHATQLLPIVGDFKRYRVLEWLNYITSELHKGFGPLFNPNLSQDMKDQVFIPLLKYKLQYIDSHLKEHQYLLGEQFTLPDAYLFVMILWTSHFKFDLKQCENLTGYFNTLKDRESIQKSLKQEGLM